MKLSDAMAYVPGGHFWMGEDDFYPEERPRRRERVDDFWMDRYPVTNRQFGAFVQETGYRTLAERGTALATHGAPALGGSMVFLRPLHTAAARQPGSWWHFVAGANWRQPHGPGSTIADLLEHPVVHLALEDALAFAVWAGKDLPTEREWERAARGGFEGRAFAWGDELAPDGRMMANYWQGSFPHHNALEDGYEGTSPVGAFPQNGYGLYDMIGNVWEWTRDDYRVPSQPAAASSCCRQAASPSSGGTRKVIKGGSFLCAENYCQRYRPAARHPQDAEVSTSHLGFRCVVR